MNVEMRLEPGDMQLVYNHVQPDFDDRLRLIFTCCHAALPRAAQIALTLRVVCGLTTAQIARAFLVRETTVAQRITRAKRKIIDAGVPYRIPSHDELAGRLAEVLTVIYLLLNEGYLSTDAQPHSRNLVDEAEWLATLLHQLASALDRYHLYHATRADLLRELGDPDQAQAADRQALRLTANPARTSAAPGAHRLDLTLRLGQ